MQKDAKENTRPIRRIKVQINIFKSTAFEMALFGTGVMKGPFAVDKEYPNWDDEVNMTHI